jgi:hypothetical protein
MTDRALPAWEGDPLSTFLADAQRNERACALNWPDVYAVLQRAHGLLKLIGEILEKDPEDANLLAPRLLIFRSHSAILAATRLAMSGQGFEAQPVLRAAIEQAWYALHIARDPTPPARARIWWGRDDSPQATQACKDEFTVGNVRRTHEGLDAATAAAMKSLYEDTITFGGHPNERGVASSLRIDRSGPDAATIGVGFLHPGTPTMAAALKGAADVSVGIAKTVSLIYPERFRIAGVNEEIDRLVRLSGGDVFSKYVQPQRRYSSAV